MSLFLEDREFARWEALFNWQWETYVGKDVYSQEHDKVFEITGLESDEDDSILFYCDEKIGEDTYGYAHMFKPSEVSMVILDWKKSEALLLARDNANNEDFKAMWNNKLMELLR
jgi:hypothetical protein